MAGLLLGAIFFGGLWWTVRKGVSAKRPALLVSRQPAAADELSPSRASTVVGGGHWERLLACLLGFVIARLIVTRLTGPPVEHHDAPAKEAGHAP